MLLFIQLVIGEQVRAAGLRDLQDSWLVGRTEAWHLLGKSPRPVASIRHEGPFLALEAVRGRLFSMVELEQSQVELGVTRLIRKRQAALSGSWQNLGGGIYRESMVRLAGMVGRFPGVGIRLQKEKMTVANQEVWSGVGLDMILGHLIPLGQEAVLCCGLVLPLKNAGPPAGQSGRREFLDFALIRFRTALVIKVDRHADGTPVLGFDFFWGSAAGLGASLRVDPATGSLGPGIYLRRGALMLRTSHLTHPILGQTHRFSLTITRAHG